jgi:hypothetical protein
MRKSVNVNYFAFGVDALAELVVLSHVRIWHSCRSTIEGNPVSGIPSGGGAGWIPGQTTHSHFYPSLQYEFFNSLSIVQRPKHEPLSNFSAAYDYYDYVTANICDKTVGSP